MLTYNLPNHSTPFVGRDDELTMLQDLLSQVDCRLLSLIGAGGMGKTRLALELAQRQFDQGYDGVYYIALQALQDADDIFPAILSTIGIESSDELESAESELIAALDDKRIFLVLDNFEHLLEGTVRLNRLLQQLPKITVLVTSREPLNLQIEWVRTVNGLSLPDETQTRSSALDLFVQHAMRASAQFDSMNEQSDIIKICELVGGMPLGIILAAAWTRHLNCAEIALEIERSADILTTQMRDLPERHQSIRAVFESTWQMLNSEQQYMLMALSIFKDKPTRQAILGVTNGNLLTLVGLVDSALVQLSDDDGRYHFHELLRQYAYEKLGSSGLLDRVRDAHCDYYMTFMRDREADLHGGRQIEASAEIADDFENIRLAWYRAIETRDYDRIGGAVEALCSYLWMRSRWYLDSHILTKAVKALAPQANEEPHPVWGMLLGRNHPNGDDSVRDLHQAIDIAEGHNNQSEIGMYHYLLGNYWFMYEHRQETSSSKKALFHCEQSVLYCRAGGNSYHESEALVAIAYIYTHSGEFEQSVPYFEQVLAIKHAINDIQGIANCIRGLSTLKNIMGLYEEAEYYAKQAIAYWQDLNRIAEYAHLSWDYGFHILFIQYGDVNGIQAIYEEVIEIKQKLHLKENWFNLAEWLGIVAVLEGDYETAMAYGKQSFDINPSSIAYACAASSSHDFAILEMVILEFLKQHDTGRDVPHAFYAILFMAILEAYHYNNPQRSAELLALVSTHEKSPSGWLKCWTFIDRLHEHLRDVLGHVAYETAWEQGQTLNWQMVVNELLKQYLHTDNVDDAMTIPPAIQTANATLKEPLSGRELEVLLKIAEGCSNREIAEALFIGVSTVKKHITHIYGKLQVDNRTQAVLKMQEWLN